MEKTIFNLVRNTISHDVGEYFVKEIAKQMTPEEVIELAEQELKAIEYFVRIELPSWNYWKEKKQRLNYLIRCKKLEIKIKER